MPLKLVPASASETFKQFTRKQKFAFISLAFGFTLVYCADTNISPFYPAEAAKHGVSSSWVGVVFSSRSLSTLLAGPFIGMLIAAIGPKILIIAGMVVSGVSLVLFGLLELVESRELFIAGSFLCIVFTALGETAVYCATLTYAAKIFPGKMNLVVGTMESLYVVADVVPFLTGGILHDIGGFKLPFIAFAGIQLLVIPLQIIMLPKDETEDEIRKNSQLQLEGHEMKVLESRTEADSIPATVTAPSPETLKNGKKIPEKLRLWHLLLIPRAVIVGLVIVVTEIIWSFVSSTLEPHLSPLNLTKTQVNLIFLMNSAAFGFTCPIWGWIADRMERTWLLMSAALGVASIAYCFLGPLPFLGLENTVWLNIVTLFVINACLAAANTPACEAALLYTIEAGHRDNVATYAIVSSFISTAYSGGGTIGSFTGGFLLDYFGYPTSAAIYGSIALIWGIFLFGYFMLCHNKPVPRTKKSDKGTPSEETTVVSA